MAADLEQRSKDVDISVRTPDPELQVGDVPDRQEGRIHEMFALERARIESFNRRTDLARMAIEKADASDQRQFEFHSQRLQVASEHRAENRRLLQKILWAVGIPLGVVIFGVLCMIFFGTDRQSEMAIKLFEIGASAVGGVGIFLFVKGLAQKFFSNAQGE